MENNKLEPLKLRPRNSSLTREAILESARECFSQSDYEHVSVRTIARKAGVDAALINRYFGNKEALFRKSLDYEDPQSPDRIAKLKDLLADREHFGERLAKLVLTERRDRSAGDPMLILLRSVGQPAAENLVKDRMREWLEPLVEVIGGPDAHVRAEMILALLAGFDLFRNVICSSGFGSSNDDILVKLLGGALQAQLAI